MRCEASEILIPSSHMDDCDTYTCHKQNHAIDKILEEVTHLISRETARVRVFSFSLTVSLSFSVSLVHSFLPQLAT